MKIIDYISKMNGKKSLSLGRIFELKEYYIAMYRYNMMLLYEKGYINDPTIFDNRQIYRNVSDLGVNIFSTSGRIELKSEWVGYALAKATKEQEEFLSILLEVLKYREYSEDLDRLFDGFNGKNISLKISTAGSKLYSRNEYPISRGNLMCLVSSDETLHTLDIKEDLWEIAMQVLEIPKDEWYCDGLFVKELSHKDEVKYINILLEGCVSLSGSKAKVVEDWLFEHKWSNSSMSLVKKGLISYIYSAKSDDVYKAFYRVLDTIDSSSVVAILADTIYYRAPIKTYKVPIGYFIVDGSAEDTLLGGDNAMSGYTGEVYSSEYLVSEDIPYVGVPIKVVDNAGDVVYLYDREQADIKSETWFKTEDAQFSFEPLDVLNPFKDVESLPYKVFEIYANAQNGDLGSISLSDEVTVKAINVAKGKVAKKLKEC